MISRSSDTTRRGNEPLDVEKIRDDFPILKQIVHGKPLAYLDNAASTQKPNAVIDATATFYTRQCANVHRGLHELGSRATAEFEAARDKIQRFIGAAQRNEIIYTRGTTESINLIAHSYGERNIGEGDEIILTQMEHHSNIIPWQLLCERTGATIKVVPIDDDGDLIMDGLERLFSKRTRLVALNMISNALGTRNPVERVIEMAHAHNVPVVVDGAQAAAHETIDVQALDCDFFAFSGHKMFGALGIGVLYGKMEHLEKMPPFHGGGEMIHTVSFESSTYREPPYRFEAGTPNIVGAIGMGAAVDYLEAIGLDRIAELEAPLLAYGTERLREIPQVRLIGTAKRKAAILSFVVEGVHAHDVGTVLDLEGIAVRAGHHCAQPVMERFGVVATVRASLALYNTREEIDRLIAGIHRVLEVFG